MALLRWHGRLARPRRTTIAVAASIALHLAVGFAIARVAWSVTDGARPPLHVVWIDEWPQPSKDAEAPPAPEPAPQPTDEAAPARDAESQQAQSGAQTPRAPPAEVPEAEQEPASREQTLPRGVDWELERKNAVARVLEAQAREQGRITFSSEELFEEPEAEPPNPREHIFDSPQRGSSHSALTPGQGRSRFANRVAAICNALTGGLGISLQGLGVGTLCADPGPGADFFADLRPAYMESLPVCVETRDPLLNPEGSNGFPTIKCRLVPKDELE